MKRCPPVSQGQRHIQRRFHHLSHTAHRAISIHNILEVSSTSCETIQTNSKRRQSLIKASKSFRIHKVCFRDPRVIQIPLFSGEETEQFTSSVCVHARVFVCFCVCVFLRVLLFLGFARVALTSDPARSAPDITAPLSSPHFHSSDRLQPLCSSGRDR